MTSRSLDIAITVLAVIAVSLHVTGYLWTACLVILFVLLIVTIMYISGIVIDEISFVFLDKKKRLERFRLAFYGRSKWIHYWNLFLKDEPLGYLHSPKFDDNHLCFKVCPFEGKDHLFQQNKWDEIQLDELKVENWVTKQVKQTMCFKYPFLDESEDIWLDVGNIVPNKTQLAFCQRIYLWYRRTKKQKKLQS